MARSYLTFGDIAGKLDMLRVECTKCERRGRYNVARLIEQHGRDANAADWLADLRDDCVRRDHPVLAQRCDLRCPDVPKVL